MKKSKVIRFGISMEPELLWKFDGLIEKKGYANRSEAVRDLVREHLVGEEWEVRGKEVLGTITLVYNHHARDLADRLTHLQHHYYKNIISSTHVHIDEHNCLEVLAVKGKSDKVREIADRLISAKGVKHGKLAMSTTGKGIS